jgi:hypothetical protein
MHRVGRCRCSRQCLRCLGRRRKARSVVGPSDRFTVLTARVAITAAAMAFLSVIVRSFGSSALIRPVSGV